MDAAAFEQVYGSFRDFHAYFAPLFGRRETREHSGHYLQALLVQSGERRNAENLSETVPGSARGMQRFLTDSPWDDEVIIGRLQEYLGTRLEQPEGVWTAATFPSRGGSRWEWPGSTAGGWGRWPTARRGMSARWDGHWWTRGCICPRVGPRTKTGVRRRVCRRIGRATGPRRKMVGRAQERGHLKAGWVAADDAFGKRRC